MLVCTDWDMLPDTIERDESYDISSLPAAGPEMCKTVCVLPGRAVTIFGADDRTFRNLSFCLTGDNTLRLISVHLSGNKACPPLRVDGSGNCVQGEQMVKLACTDKHPAVCMGARGEVNFIACGPCRYTIAGVGRAVMEQ